MAQRRHRRSRKRQPRSVYWRGHIQSWISSGLTQVDFCQQHELSLPAFRWWRWKLKQEDAENEALSTPQESSGQSMRLVPVRVVERELAGLPAPRVSASGERATTFEVLLESGTCIRVPEDFDAESLGRLLRTLEAVRC